MAVECLLRRQVIGGAEHVFFVRHRERSLVVFVQFREAQVKQLYRTVTIDQAVGWFNIAVDQAHFMSVLKSIRDLGNVIGGRVVIQRPLSDDELMQVLPVDVFHYDVMGVAVVIDVVRSNNVRIVEPGNGTGLETKPFQVRRIADTISRQNLNRHAALHQFVLGEINAAHAAFADLAKQLVFAETEAFVLAGQQFIGLPAGDEVVCDQQLGQCDSGLRELPRRGRASSSQETP